MEDLNNIEQLLEKYYHGESNLEEERKLQWFFQTQDVPERFQADKKLFRYYYQTKTEELVPGLNERLTDLIDKQDGAGRRLVSNRFLRWAGSAAAIIVVLVAVWMGTKEMYSPQASDFQDTYDDPVIAYNETKKVLFLVSGKMNTGTKSLQTLNSLNKGVKNLAPIFSIGPGFQHLEKLSKFNETIELISK